MDSVRTPTDTQPVPTDTHGVLWVVVVTVGANVGVAGGGGRATRVGSRRACRRGTCVPACRVKSAAAGPASRAAATREQAASPRTRAAGSLLMWWAAAAAAGVAAAAAARTHARVSWPAGGCSPVKCVAGCVCLTLLSSLRGPRITLSVQELARRRGEEELDGVAVCVAVHAGGGSGGITSWRDPPPVWRRQAGCALYTRARVSACRSQRGVIVVVASGSGAQGRVGGLSCRWEGGALPTAGSTPLAAAALSRTCCRCRSPAGCPS